MKKGGLLKNSTYKSFYVESWVSFKKSRNLWTPISAKEFVKNFNVLFPWRDTNFIEVVKFPVEVYFAYVNITLWPSLS